MALEAKVRPLVYASGALLLGVGGTVLVLLHEWGSLEPRLVALILGGTSVISFVVGYFLSYFADRNRTSGSGDGG